MGLVLLAPIGLIALIVGFVLFVLHPRWGVMVLLLELMLGGNGRWFELYGGVLTLRYLLIGAVIAGFFIHLLLTHKSIPILRSQIPLATLGIVLIYGISVGFISRNADPIQDAQVWLYLFLYPIIVSLWKNRGIPWNLVRLLLWSIAGIAFIQLSLLVYVNMVGWAAFSPFYPSLEKIRILVSILMGTSIYYVFMGNSSLYGIGVAVPLLLATLHRTSRTRVLPQYQLWLIASLSFIATILSMTRGSWGQLVITLTLITGYYVLHLKLPKKLTYLSMAMLGLVLVPIFTLDSLQKALVSRFSTLIPGNYDPSHSISFKLSETAQLLAAINERPLVGYGFGIGAYQQFDILKDRIYFHNSYLQFGLKTGIIGLFILLLVFAVGIFMAFRIGSLFKVAAPEYRSLLYGLSFSFIGVLFVTVSNPHMTTPIFITEFALLLAFTDLAYQEWKNLHHGELPL